MALLGLLVSDPRRFRRALRYSESRASMNVTRLSIYASGIEPAMIAVK